MNKYAVLIGNSQFPDETDKTKLPDLACPVQDVDGLSKVLASERGEFDVLALKNEPSYKILRELQRRVKQAESDDLLLVYYSGHGKPNKSNILHLTTFDTVVAELATSAISMNRIYEILSEAKCRKIVIILDCCYSGAAGQGFKGAVDDQLQQLNNARGTYLVTASTELQVAHESAAEGLSLFTKHLIAGLETGEADKDGDGSITMDELYDYVQGKVIAENPNQQPTKHVKEERGCSFPIAKSGRKSRPERAEKIESYFYELAKEKRIARDILTEVLRIIETPVKELSAIDKTKDTLISQVFENKNAVDFVRNWDKLAVENKSELQINKSFLIGCFVGTMVLLVLVGIAIKNLDYPNTFNPPNEKLSDNEKKMIKAFLAEIETQKQKELAKKSQQTEEEAKKQKQLDIDFAIYIKQRDKQREDMQAALDKGVPSGFHFGTGDTEQQEQVSIDDSAGKKLQIMAQLYDFRCYVLANDESFKKSQLTDIESRPLYVLDMNKINGIPTDESHTLRLYTEYAALQNGEADNLIKKKLSLQQAISGVKRASIWVKTDLEGETKVQIYTARPKIETTINEKSMTFQKEVQMIFFSKDAKEAFVANAIVAELAITANGILMTNANAALNDKRLREIPVSELPVVIH